MSIRPRRSVLYMPGSNARALDKARTLPADALILDLEDAVSPDAKELARCQVAEAVTQGGYGRREVLVRVNGLATAWGMDDLTVVAELPIDGIVFPKIETPEQVFEAVATVDRIRGSTDVGIWIMAETPRCMFRIHEIAAVHSRLTGIIMGTSDLAKEMRVRHTPARTGLLAPLNLCVLAARANSRSIIDGVHLDLNDEAGFRAVCEQGRDMGFDGKTLIHPKQIETANAVFAPSAEEIAHAREVLAAWEQARAEGKGVVVVSGRLVEELHVDEARRVLALATAIAES